MQWMRLTRVARQRLRSVLRESRADKELAGELAFHLEQLIRENLAAGMSVAEAQSAARRQLGNIGLLAEQCRDQRRVSWLRDLRQDAVYGWRMMRKNAGFTAVAAISLALAIGANTAILGTAEAMLFGPLPYRDPDRLAVVRTYPFHNPGSTSNASQPDFFAIQDRTKAFESTGCSLADQKNLGADGDVKFPQKIFGQQWSQGLAGTLGTQPLLGRMFSAADYHRGPPTVVILSYGLWQTRFGGDSKVVGRRVRLDGHSTEVIGVMPPHFRFAEDGKDYWVPLQLARSTLQAGVRYFIVVARLRRGATMAQAQAELDQVAGRLAAEFPDTHQGWGMRAQPMREALFGWTRPVIVTLETAVLLALLIACANMAGLLLARGVARGHEMAMRAALGAGRSRIVRQFLAESLMLSSLGGVLGIVIAGAALRMLPAIHPPPWAPRLEPVTLNLPMLAITGLGAIATALVFGIAPALAAFRQDLSATLQESPRNAGAPRAGQRLRSMLVAAQIACAFVLLIGSGLMLRSLWQLAHRELNFDPHGLACFEFRLPTWQFQSIVGTYDGAPYVEAKPGTAGKFQAILQRLRAVPGMEAVAGISTAPLNSPLVPAMNVKVEGASTVAGETSYFAVTPGFFETMRTPLIQGREFADADTAGRLWGAVVNATAAERFWPGQDAVGKRFTVDTGMDRPVHEVIGVVRDIPTGSRQLRAEPVVYVSYLQQAPRNRLSWGIMLGQMTFVARGADPAALARAAQKAVAEIDPDVPLARTASMEDLLSAWDSGLSYYAAVLGAFAFMATLSAAMGAFGVVSFHVAQRRREIGIRMALGAGPIEMVRLIGAQVAALLGSGLLLGWMGAVALSPFLEPMLWRVRPTDAEAYAGAVVLLAAAAGLACAAPLWRCLRTTPLSALRGR